jgi:ribonuclease R
VVGREDQPRAASLIALHAHGLPTGFPSEAEAEAEAAEPPTLAGRTDLRDIPLVTIDPPDARDHDDAVYAEPDPDHPGGWIVWVAIADVAAYVRTGSALDRTARDKGNSVYFPDRVEPMLPHRLSSGLCSLVEGENRACMAVRMVFNAQGQKTGHRFVRGLMRSAGKLSYEQAQDAIDGRPDDRTGPLMARVLEPLWAAYRTMLQGPRGAEPAGDRHPRAPHRAQRGGRGHLHHAARLAGGAPADRGDDDPGQRLRRRDAGAEKSPLIYRVHDTPSQEKVFALADFLQTIGLPWNKGEPPRTERFNRLLRETRDGPHADIVNEVVLRTQMQAIYSDENVGHFGLNLTKYAHFTSPIRRYADLVVHRALVRALGLGADGLTEADLAVLKDTAEHITATERRAMAAERDANDRYVAAYLQDREGAEFEGRVTGVTRFGLFVRLTETGADGLVPVSSLGDEYFIHDDRAHALVGERSGRRFPLGMRVDVRLREATPVTGGLLFEMLTEAEPPPRARRGPGWPSAGV